MVGGTVYRRSGEACGGIISLVAGDSGWREDWVLSDFSEACLGLGRLMVVDQDAVIVGFDGMAGFRAGRLQGALLLKAGQGEPFVLQQTILALLHP